MGKRHVYTIPVPKGVTVTLLVLTTMAMMALVWFLSGRAYVGDAQPMRDLLKRLLGSGPRGVSADAILASLTPAIANFLLFVPWGFFAFLAADTDSRSRARTYALTGAAAILFTISLYFWQGHLPTRVTALPDTIAQTLGALAGAAMGHARKTVRVRFDF